MRQLKNSVQVPQVEASRESQANLFLMLEFGVQRTKPNRPNKQQYQGNFLCEPYSHRNGTSNGAQARTRQPEEHQKRTDQIV
jgi:hypothetical protein